MPARAPAQPEVAAGSGLEGVGHRQVRVGFGGFRNRVGPYRELERDPMHDGEQLPQGARLGRGVVRRRRGSAAPGPSGVRMIRRANELAPQYGTGRAERPPGCRRRPLTGGGQCGPADHPAHVPAGRHVLRPPDVGRQGAGDGGHPCGPLPDGAGQDTWPESTSGWRSSGPVPTGPAPEGARPPPLRVRRGSAWCPALPPDAVLPPPEELSREGEAARGRRRSGQPAGLLRRCRGCGSFGFRARPGQPW